MTVTSPDDLDDNLNNDIEGSVKVTPAGDFSSGGQPSDSSMTVVAVDDPDVAAADESGLDL